MLGYSIGIAVGAWEMRRLLKYKKEWTVTHTCQAQLALACVLLYVAELFGLIYTLRPWELNQYLPGTDQRTTPLFYAKQILSSLGYSALFLALATLPFHWREIANQAFRPNKKKLSYFWPVAIFELLFASITIVLVALSMPNAAYIAAIPFVIIVISLYGVWGFALYRVLMNAAEKQVVEQRARFIKSAGNVARTSLKTFGVGLSVLLFSLLFALMSTDTQWRENSPPGKLSTPVAIGSCLNISLMIAALFNQYYLSATIRSSVARASSKDGFGTNSNKNLTPAGDRRVQVDTVTGDHSAQPDSIVGMDNPRDIKKKTKALARKREPRLRAITDMSEAQSTNNPQHVWSTNVSAYYGADEKPLIEEEQTSGSTSKF